MSATMATGPSFPVTYNTRSPDEAGFVADHGLWAPGVRLFRALRFTAEAPIISCAFRVPMIGLAGWLLTTPKEEATQSRMDALPPGSMWGSPWAKANPRN